MKVAPKIVLASLLASGVFGFVAQYVLYSKTVGLNLTTLIAAGICILLWLYRKRVIEPDISLGYLIAPMAIVAYGFGVPDSRNLVFLNGVVGFLCLGYYGLRTCARKPINLVQSIFKAPLVGFGYPFAGFLLPFTAEWRQLRSVKPFRLGRGVLLGGILAVPFLVLFGSVLGQADPLFARLFEPRFDVDLDTFVLKTIIFAFTTLIMAGVIIYLSKPLFSQVQHFMTTQIAPSTTAPPVVPAKESVTQEVESDRNDHVTVFATFFGLISALFALFMIVQVRYLFGGASVVLRTQGLTYAEYAKRGFLEIASVETICLPLLIFGQYALKNLNKTAQRTVNILISIVIGLLLLLMASAAFRLKLYVDNYGFTPLRFYVAAGMIWLLSLLGAYLRYGLRWQLDRIGKFAYTSMVGVTLGVNLARPDYWIARINLTRKVSQGIDADMITGAGADAYSAIIQFGGENRMVGGKSRNLLQEFLNNQHRRSHDWRDMTYSQYAISNR